MNETKPPVRFGVIGVGGMGSSHCKTMARVEEARLTAVCDIRPERAAEIGKTYDVPHFTRHRDLLRAGLCDAVVVATEHPPRAAVAIDCMRAGLHVLSEKPLSERVSTADEMIATAERTDTVLAVMFQRRSWPAVAKARQLIADGMLGRLYRRAMICLEYRSQAYYDAGGWRATWVGEGGGVLVNQAPHLMDMFLHLGGMPDWVEGHVATRLHKIDVEDHAEALLRYPDGGTGYVYCSTCEPGPGERLEIFGDKGKLFYVDGKFSLYTFDQPVAEFTVNNTEMWKAPMAQRRPFRFSRKPAGHGAVVQNFARHLLQGEPLVAPGASGLYSLELANAIWLSADQGRPVTLPIGRRDYDAFLERKRREFPIKTRVTEDKRVTDTGRR